MEKLEIKANSIKTPYASLDPETGIIELSGMSCTENASEFFKPLMKWAAEYTKNPQPKTIIECKLTYFNTNSSKCILDFLESFLTLKENGNELEINWYYQKDDDEMIDAAEDLGDILGFKFNLLESKEMDNWNKE